MNMPNPSALRWNPGIATWTLYAMFMGASFRNADAAPGSSGLAREWDELRVADVDPNRISTFATTRKSESGFFNLAKMYFFGRDWLRIEGSTRPDNFLSSNFRFQRLEYPSEWSAALIKPVPVTLRVGSTCNCSFQGISGYAKNDGTSWLRLQFDTCSGCESTASRAAVVMPLMADTSDIASNLYNWMCAISDPSACRSLTPKTKPSTTTESTTKAVVTTQPTTTSKPCDFGGAVGVQTAETHHGKGKCLEAKDAVKRSNSVPSLQSCQILCDLTYTVAAAGYPDLKSTMENLNVINDQKDVCKGYSFSAKDKKCIIYLGSAKTETDLDEDWECVGDVHAKSYSEASSLSADCTTLPPTTTTTTTTATTTSTTTTVTRNIEALDFYSLFGASAENAKVYGDPGEAHFPRAGMEATLLQMQADHRKCFPNVDYYMLGTALPVEASTWDELERLLQDFGSPSAWPSKNIDDCPAMVTVDRIPVDADFSDRAGIVMMSQRQQLLLSLALVVFLGVVGAFCAMVAKSVAHPRGVQPHSDADASYRFSIFLWAWIAAVITVPLVYGLGQVLVWFVGRLAVKKFAHGGSADLLCAAPMLTDLCLPAAVTAGCATFLIWLVPAEKEKVREIQYQRDDFHLRYDPDNHSLQSRKISAA